MFCVFTSFSKHMQRALSFYVSPPPPPPGGRHIAFGSVIVIVIVVVIVVCVIPCEQDNFWRVRKSLKTGDLDLDLLGQIGRETSKILALFFF